MWNRIITCVLAASCIALTFVLAHAGGSPAPASSPATLPVSVIPAKALSSAEDDTVLNQRLKELAFDKVGLQDAIATIANLTKANIYIDWRSLEGAGIDHQAPVRLHLWNVTLRQALNLLLEDVGGGTTKLAFSMSEGVITITTAENASRDTITEIFDIRDLVDELVKFYASRAKGTANPPPNSQNGARLSYDVAPTYQECVDMLVKLITDTVAPDSWRDSGGTVGSIREIGGLLIVTETRWNLNAVNDLLVKVRDALHRHQFPPATRPAQVGKNN